MLRNLRLIAVCVLFFGIGFCCCAKNLNVGIVFDGPSDSTLAFVESIVKELPNTLLQEDSILFPEKNRISAKFNSDAINNGITQLMNSKEVDAILAIGPVASHMVATFGNLKKPVIATHIYNAAMQKLSRANGTSNRKYLGYIDMNLDISEHIKRFKEIRTFKKLHILMSPYMLKGIPQLADSLKFQTAKAGVELEILTSDIKVQSLPNRLEGSQALYIAPLPDLPEPHKCMFLARINELKIPTMAMFGRNMLDCGVLCTIATGIDTQKLARRIANNLSRMLYGEDPSVFSTEFTHTQRLTINMETCRKVGVFPSFSQMTDADIINEEEQTNRRISITQAIETALAKNLARIAKKQELEVSRHSLDKSRAALVPRGNMYVRQVDIDNDRSKSMFTPAQHSTQIGGNLKFTIISEEAKANIDVQKYFLAAKKDEERALMLDIIQNSAVAYLNVLKAKTLKNIQTDNLEVTKANLELARQRESVGTASPAEVYRWEIQMATARQAVVEASKIKKKSEIALNESLSAKQDEVFNTLEEDIFSDVFFFDYGRIAPYIDNISSFRVLSSFLIEDAFLFSPELSAVNKNLDAIARMRRAHRRRQQYRPTLDLSAGITRTIDKQGSGRHKPKLEDINMPLGKALGNPALPNVSLPLSSLFKFPDDNDWSVAISLTFPVFDGALTGAAIREADCMLDSLRAKRDDLMQKLELKTRASLEDAKASFISINLAKTRVEYAEKAFEVVRNAYSRGAVDLLDLIDAQNASRIAKEAYANAVFTFLSDFVQVCRSIGTFDFIMNQRSNNEYYERIEDYFKVKGVSPVIRSFDGVKNEN